MTVAADTLAEDFARDGVLCLRSALDAREMALVDRAYDHRLARLTERAAWLYPKPGTTFMTDMTNKSVWHDPPFKRLLEETSLGEIARRCFGGGQVWFYYEQIFLKEGESRRTPWHQDSSYLPVGGPDQARIWIPLDPVPIEDALEFVAGSHRGLTYNTSSFSEGDDTEPFDPTIDLPRLPDIEANRAVWPIVSWALVPGDLLVFHPALLHGGGATRASGRRRTLTIVMIGEDAQYQPHFSADTPAEVGADADGGFAGLLPGDPFRLPDLIRIPLPAVNAAG